MPKRKRKAGPPAAPAARQPMRIRADTVSASDSPFVMMDPPPGVVPTTGRAAVQTANDYLGGLYDYASGGLGGALGGGITGIRWLGYAVLAELSQRAEFRNIVETWAGDMTREWIEWHATGDDDKSERIGKLEDAMRRLDVQDVFRRAVELDGYFGRIQIFPDLGAGDEELAKPLVVTPAKIGKGDLKALRTIEPFWTYPIDYDAPRSAEPRLLSPA